MKKPARPSIANDVKAAKEAVKKFSLSSEQAPIGRSVRRGLPVAGDGETREFLLKNFNGPEDITAALRGNVDDLMPVSDGPLANLRDHLATSYDHKSWDKAISPETASGLLGHDPRSLTLEQLAEVEAVRLASLRASTPIRGPQLEDAITERSLGLLADEERRFDVSMHLRSPDAQKRISGAAATLGGSGWVDRITTPGASAVEAVRASLAREPKVTGLSDLQVDIPARVAGMKSIESQPSIDDPNIGGPWVDVDTNPRPSKPGLQGPSRTGKEISPEEWRAKFGEGRIAGLSGATTVGDAVNGMPPLPANWQERVSPSQYTRAGADYAPPPGSVNVGASSGAPSVVNYTSRIAGLPNSEPVSSKPAGAYEIPDPWEAGTGSFAKQDRSTAPTDSPTSGTVPGGDQEVSREEWLKNFGEGSNVSGGAGGGGNKPPRVVGTINDMPDPDESSRIPRPQTRQTEVYEGEFVDSLPPPQQPPKRKIPDPVRDAYVVGGVGKQLWNGLRSGWDYSHDKGGFARSAIWHRAPKENYAGFTGTERAGFGAGRVVGDIVGEGSRSLLWRVQPEDVVGTHTGELFEKQGVSKPVQATLAKTANLAMALAAGNLALNNLGEAGRPEGYSAIEADPNDPRKTTNVASEYFNRAVMGRTGRLLPWNQFHEERPDVDYETYNNYQNYLRDSGPAFGVIKGTWDGIDGPELRVAGYRLNPAAVLAPLAVIGGGLALARRGIIR